MDSDRAPVALAESPTRLTPSTWSPDGKRLTFYEFPANRIGIVSQSSEAASQAKPQYLNFTGSTHDISVDGRWLAYADAGVNVRPLPAGESVQKIADRGAEPRWCRKCDELVYRNGNRWYSTEVHLGPQFEWKQPRLIVQTQFNDSHGPSWALSPDGQRILVVKRKEELPRTRLHVIHGWLADVAGRN